DATEPSYHHLTAPGRKLQVIDFSKQCCLNATRRRGRVVCILGRKHAEGVSDAPSRGRWVTTLVLTQSRGVQCGDGEEICVNATAIVTSRANCCQERLIPYDVKQEDQFDEVCQWPPLLNQLPRIVLEANYCEAMWARSAGGRGASRVSMRSELEYSLLEYSSYWLRLDLERQLFFTF